MSLYLTQAVACVRLLWSVSWRRELTKRVLSMRPLKIGTFISMHFAITSRRFMLTSSASSVGVRWTATYVLLVRGCRRSFTVDRGRGQHFWPQFAASTAVPGRPHYLVAMADPSASDVAASAAAHTSGSFLESLMDTDLYSIGAFFSDEH